MGTLPFTFIHENSLMDKLGGAVTSLGEMRMYPQVSLR